MPTPMQEQGYHRMLLRDPRELPTAYESSFYTDGDGIRRHRAVYPDEEGDSTFSLVAMDYPATRYSPADVMRDAVGGGYFERRPFDFLPAPSLVQRDVGMVGDDGESTTAGRPLRIERTDDGRVFLAGICYVAGELDTHGDFMRQPELADFAHSLVRQGHVRGDADHDRIDREGIALAQSVMVREDGDELIVDPDGAAWWVKYEVTDPIIIARTELPPDHDDALTAFSWEGLLYSREAIVTREAMAPNAAEARVKRLDELVEVAKADTDADTVDKDDEGQSGRELYGGRAIRVSLVRRGANRRQFVTLSKSADADTLHAEGDDDATAPGLLARVKAAVFGRPSTASEGPESLDIALDSFAKGCREIIECDPANAVDHIKTLSTDLGNSIADRAGTELRGSVLWGRDYFAPRHNEDKIMNADQINEIAKTAALEAVKALKADEPAPAPKADDEPEPVTRADLDAAVAEAAKLGAEQAIETVKAQHAETVTAKDVEITALQEQVKQLGRAPKATPTATGNDDDAPPAGEKKGDNEPLGLADQARQNREKFETEHGAWRPS